MKNAVNDLKNCRKTIRINYIKAIHAWFTTDQSYTLLVKRNGTQRRTKVSP